MIETKLLQLVTYFTPSFIMTFLKCQNLLCNDCGKKSFTVCYTLVQRISKYIDDQNLIVMSDGDTNACFALNRSQKKFFASCEIQKRRIKTNEVDSSCKNYNESSKALDLIS